jgi:uncharacterized membrane protein
VFTVPLPTVVILGMLFTIVSAVLARRERPDFYFLFVASVCIVAVALITAFGNIPINNQIKMWNIGSPPADWGNLADRWWWFQTMRTIAAVGGLSLLIIAALTRRGPSSRGA